MKKFFFAQKAFILNEGNLLAVQKSDEDPYNPKKWEVPGGRMDFGEDVDEHLRREVAEEVGLTVLPQRPFHVWQWQLERTLEDTGELLRMQIVAVARLCTPLTLEIDHSGRVAEDFLGQSDWIPVQQLKTIDFIDNMKPVLDKFLTLPEVRK